MAPSIGRPSLHAPFPSPGSHEPSTSCPSPRHRFLGKRSRPEPPFFQRHPPHLSSRPACSEIRSGRSVHESDGGESSFDRTCRATSATTPSITSLVLSKPRASGTSIADDVLAARASLSRATARALCPARQWRSWIASGDSLGNDGAREEPRLRAKKHLPAAWSADEAIESRRAGLGIRQTPWWLASLRGRGEATVT